MKGGHWSFEVQKGVRACGARNLNRDIVRGVRIQFQLIPTPGWLTFLVVCQMVCGTLTLQRLGMAGSTRLASFAVMHGYDLIGYRDSDA